MNIVEKDGATRRAHFQRDAEGLLPNPASVAKLAEETFCPPSADDVWVIFLDLHLRRPHNEFGPLRFPWTEIQAYLQAKGIRLASWQRQALFAVEDEYFKVKAANEPNKKDDKAKNNER